jgi:hypothetical protein
MKRASAWMIAALAAAALAIVSKPRRVGVAEVSADMVADPLVRDPAPAPGASPASYEATDAVSPAQAVLAQGVPEQAVAEQAAPAQAFPPQPPDDQVKYLRQMVRELQQENEQLGALDDEVAGLRQQEADRDQEQEAEAEEEFAQHAATLQALDTLRQADQMLAAGNWEGVDDELADAEAALSGRTRLEVEAAREALAREDLYPARQHIAAALAQRRPLR